MTKCVYKTNSHLLPVLVMTFSRMGLFSNNPGFLKDSVQDTGSLMEYIPLRLLAVTLSYFGTIYDQYLNDQARLLLVRRTISGYHIARESKFPDSNATEKKYFAWGQLSREWSFDSITNRLLSAKYESWVTLPNKDAFDLTYRLCLLYHLQPVEIPIYHLTRLKGSKKIQPQIQPPTTEEDNSDSGVQDVQVLCDDEEDIPETDNTSRVNRFSNLFVHILIFPLYFREAYR